MSARERILARVRDALEERPRAPHPGRLRDAGPPPHPDGPAAGFAARFTAAGGEVVIVAGASEAARWLADFSAAFEGVATGATVPGSLRSPLPEMPPHQAPLGLGMALGAVAETGSLLLSSADGRRPQLLPPTHVVVVPAGRIHATLTEALAACRGGLPAALGLHSGPSKSADIGQVLVRGVHGPGRVVALLVPLDPPTGPQP